MSKSGLIGSSYNGENVVVSSPSLNESFAVNFFNPVSGTVGTQCRVDLHIAQSDLYNYNDVLLEFAMNNLTSGAGSLDMTLYNPILLFKEVRFLINNQELIYFDNEEKLFSAFARKFRRIADPQVLQSELQSLMPQGSSFSTPLNGLTLTSGSTAQFSLPLFDMLLPHLKNIGHFDNVNTLSIEFRFQSDLGTAVSNGRFILSSTTSNPFTSANVSFTNICARLLQTKHSNALLRTVSNPVIPLHKYEDHVFTPSFNTTTSQQRVQLHIDYSHHNFCHGVLIYAFNTAGITAYNSAGCGKVDSGVDLIGWELKYRSRTIHKYDQVVDVSKRAKYLHDVYFRRYGGINPNLISASDNTSSTLCPLTFIDLQNITNPNPMSQDIHSGINNAQSELELIITNAKGTYSTSCKLVVVLCYYEFAKISKNGLLTFSK